jgi:hypothetical protein
MTVPVNRAGSWCKAACTGRAAKVLWRRGATGARSCMSATGRQMASGAVCTIRFMCRTLLLREQQMLMVRLPSLRFL